MARVLVIDDETNIRLMIRLALKASGHEVVGAADGAEGLELFGSGNFDLVLLDQRMPGMEGLEVLRELKRRQEDARVIMITAFGTVDLAVEAIKSGATDFLRKPFTAEMLRDSVQSALDGTAKPAVTVGSHDNVRALGVSVNGFRVEPSPLATSLAPDGNLSLHFMVRSAGGTARPCTVVLPAVLREVVKAYADRDNLQDDAQFWPWLGEEALANYLWQQSSPPADGTLLVDELTSNLRRWTEAVLSGP